MTGGRITLARVRWDDGPELIDSNVRNVAYHAPWVAAFGDRAGFEAWFGRSLTGPHVSLVARTTDEGALVGVVNFSEIVWGVFQSSYCGYYGYAETGGRGLMTEALTLAVRFAFDELHLHRVEANIQPGNDKSIALAQRCGFQREGFSPKYLYLDGAWRDHERWAILADD